MKKFLLLNCLKSVPDALVNKAQYNSIYNFYVEHVLNWLNIIRVMITWHKLNTVFYLVFTLSLSLYTLNAVVFPPNFRLSLSLSMFFGHRWGLSCRRPSTSGPLQLFRSERIWSEIATSMRMWSSTMTWSWVMVVLVGKMKGEWKS